MNERKSLILVCLALLLAGCRVYAQGGPVGSGNGLSCQNYADYTFLGFGGEKFSLYSRQDGAECSYICPDGTIRQPLLDEKFSSDSAFYSGSEEELDRRFCGLAAQPIPTATLASPSPTPARTATPRPTSTPTILSDETAVATTQPPPSPTAGSLATGGVPVLSGRVTMCDTGANLISFRFVLPIPDLTDRTLVVSVAGQPSACSINPVNPSLLTCTMPPGQTFPAPVLVTLDGQVVNDFLFDGLGCAQLTTPVATTTP